MDVTVAMYRGPSSSGRGRAPGPQPQSPVRVRLCLQVGELPRTCHRPTGCTDLEYPRTQVLLYAQQAATEVRCRSAGPWANRLAIDF